MSAPSTMRTPWLCCLVLAVLLLPSPQPARAEAEEAWLTSLDAARNAAEAGALPIMVDLYADWCGWCKVLEERVFSTPEFHRLAQGFVLLRVDTEDGGEGTDLAERFEAYTLPTTLLLDADLVLLGRVEGFAPAGEYIRRIETELRGYRGLMDLYRRHRDGSDPEALRMVAGQLLERGDGPRAAELYRRLLDMDGFDLAQRARLSYRLADALRLDGRYPAARDALRRAREMALTLGDEPLLEIADLLLIRIADDGGDCPAAVAAAEAFLSEYPASQYRPIARNTLRSLGPSCT